jgi:hypothetical protein
MYLIGNDISSVPDAFQKHQSKSVGSSTNGEAVIQPTEYGIAYSGN